MAVRLEGKERAEGTQDSKEFSVWYMTPADRTSSTRFEHLTLAAVLDLVPREQEITLASAAKSDRRGATLNDAVAIEAILWGTTWRDATLVRPPAEKGTSAGK